MKMCGAKPARVVANIVSVLRFLLLAFDLETFLVC